GHPRRSPQYHQSDAHARDRAYTGSPRQQQQPARDARDARHYSNHHHSTSPFHPPQQYRGMALPPLAPEPAPESLMLLSRVAGAAVAATKRRRADEDGEHDSPKRPALDVRGDSAASSASRRGHSR